MMNLFSLSWSLGVLLLLFASVVNSSGNDINELKMNHSVYVSMRGEDSPECLQNRGIRCQHLDYVFEGIREQDSTVVYVESGDYYLKKSYAWWYINNFALIGLPNRITPSVVTIHCKVNAGLSFIYSTGIIMKNISLYSCGAIQNSTSKGHLTFLTGLFLANCINFSMESVKITQSPGIGIQLYDVAGVITVSHSHFFENGKRDWEGLVNSIPGGGFYFEFTYMGGLYPFKAPPKPIYQENGTFHFFNVTFEGNSAPQAYKNNTVNPGGNEHIAFGRGGGASLFIKGSAQNNTFLFENCYFTHNYAVWGAGLFAEFQDRTKNNTIIFKLCHFNHNNVSYGGGGIRAGLINKHQDENFIPNWIRFTSCHFKNNKAILGGGISLYGTTKNSYSLTPYQSFPIVNFIKCVIEENRATVGSAFCSTLWNMNERATGGSSESFKIFIESTNITSNEFIYTEDKKVSGTGAFYAQGTPVLLDNTCFISNTRTALVLDNALVEVNGNVSFINNTGQKGGAMALYGQSKIKVAKKANLTFIENRCSVQGGAIYVRVPGPQMVGFSTTELKIHDCFFSLPVQNCNCSVSFYGNKGPSGYSVYATTLQFCRLSNENRMNNKALQWQNYFYYYYTNGTIKSDMASEIVTDAVEMEVDRSDWNTTTDKSFSPAVELFDEKNNSVYGVIKIEITPKGKVYLDPPSTYFLAKDNIKSLQIKAEPKSRYNISLLTVDSQLVSQAVMNAEVKGCEPGFLWKNYTKSCKCDETQIGVSRCDNEKQTLFLLKGYWGGHAQPKEKFVVVPCPENYCRCNQTALTSSGECLFNKDEQCSGNRENQLCGKCKPGFSLEIGEDGCKSYCYSGSRKWIGYLIAILVVLFMLVLIVMFINFDPFSAYLNAWLYSYQVLSILVPRSYISLDPFLTFIIGLAHMQVNFVGICMWPNIDDLQKFAFNYTLPVYFFICLCILNKVTVAWPTDSFLTRRFTQTSLARALCTLFVLSYSTVVNVSLNILYPVKIGDEYFVFYQGNVKYLSSYHIGFFISALILLIFVGILFPMVLLRRQWFNFIDNGLKKLLLDNFQRCFRDGYKWCAGFYFLCRFIFLVVRLTVSQDALRVSLYNSACCVTLTVFVLCQPYSDNGGTIIPYKVLNISDAVLLCNLCLISSFSGATSGVYATRAYYEGFKTVISILSYIPLVFSFGLLVYVLRQKCNGHHLLRDVE